MEFTPSPRPLWQRYLAIILYLIASIALVHVFGLLYFMWRPPEAELIAQKGLPFRFLLQSIVMQMAGFLLPAPLLLKFTRTGIFSFSAARARDVFLCCALTFASLVFFSALYHYLKVEPQQLGFLDGADILRHKTAFIAITSVAVPGYEEWVFRGLIFGVLVSGVEDKRLVFLGGFACVLLFTLSHIEGKHSLSALPPILTMAAIFQYMTWKTGSLWPAVAAHAMQNFISSAAFFAKFAAATTAK